MYKNMTELKGDIEKFKSETLADVDKKFDEIKQKLLTEVDKKVQTAKTEILTVMEKEKKDKGKFLKNPKVKVEVQLI